ncbi:metallophosphoesterase [uncultured Algimonas sp.]|uniref:metallophosphoesterase n=1 Tax=uncultured Algimonas sp. TaxID=1547920 RepID=UPI0026255368|nr:metallophosphoesterase [uncultured Algimonas sp.]
MARHPTRHLTVIGDIHGEADLLDRLLARIDDDFGSDDDGLDDDSHDDDSRGDELVFIGDLVDRGHDNRGVVETVRALVRAGRATCLMGNHELNAVLFHTRGPDGAPLREHSAKTFAQHAAFLRDYPVGAPETADVIGWFARLPLFHETHGLRLVHAEWHAGTIDYLRGICDREGRLPPDWTDRWPRDAALRAAVERVTKGTRFPLPEGRTYTDKTGFIRDTARLAWWDAAGASDLAAQIAGPSDRKALGDGVPPLDTDAAYPADAPTVVFGHYGLDDDTPYRAPNVVCTDFTRRAGGPLTAWRTDGRWVQVR